MLESVLRPQHLGGPELSTNRDTESTYAHGIGPEGGIKPGTEEQFML
jgi:hypothetical protein